MCAKEKQFGDALYILNSMRFSIYPPNSKSSPLPSPRKRAAFTWIPKPECSPFLSSTPSSINGFTFISFGQPVPTRLASHSFLHSLVKAGLPTKAAAQAKLMMADGIRIHTKTMESILASTVDQSPYPPIQPSKVLLGKVCSKPLREYPIADTHTRIAVRLLEEARRRRQERTKRMYDVVINACLIQGEIIVASLLFIMVIKDWQLREALKNQCTNNSPPGPSEPLTASPLHPTRQIHWSLLERINHNLTTRKDPQDPAFRNALQALANLAFAVDTGKLPRRLMGSLIKALYSAPESPALVYIGSPPEVQAVNAYKYFHQVLMKLVRDAGGKGDKEKDWATRQTFNVHARSALLHYCLHHRLSKSHASDILEVMKAKRRGMTLTPVNLLFRGSTLLRDDSIRVDTRYRGHTAVSAPIALPSASHAKLPLTRWAHIIDTLKLEYALQYPSEAMIHTPAMPDSYTVISLITHLTATDRGHIIAKKLHKIIPELNLVGEGGSKITMEERGRCAVSYGPHFFTTVLNALVKGGKTGYAERVWRLAVVAEKASWMDGTEPWLLPIHAYTCMLQLYSKEGRAGKVAASSRRGRSDGRLVSAMAMGRRVFRAVRIRCRFFETVEGSGVLSRVPLALREITPDERYFNALLDLYEGRALGYARPMKNRGGYWRWMAKLARDRFARNGTTTAHWHPMLAEIIVEMHKYGYEVPEGLRFLFVGRTSNVDMGDTKPPQAARPNPPPRRKNSQRIPVLKTRGLPVSRGKPRRHGPRAV